MTVRSAPSYKDAEHFIALVRDNVCAEALARPDAPPVMGMPIDEEVLRKIVE